MSIVTAVVVGVIFGVGAHLMTRRDAVELALGSMLVTNAAVLLVVAAGFRSAPSRAASHHPDPLAQALALTAVVIGFATTVLFLRVMLAVAKTHETIDLEDLVEAESAEGERREAARSSEEPP